MPKTAKAKKKVSKPKTKVVSKAKPTTAKVTPKGPVKISKTYIPKDNGGMDDNNISADIVDQANSYIDSNVEMKAINRQIKLISEIDKALRRIREDTYGYCLDTAEPIGLKRLMARPVAKYTIAAQEKHEKEEKVHADD